jgi:predicted permease
MNGSAGTIATAILPVLAIAGTGYVLRRRGLVDAAAQSSLMRVVIWVLMPSLVLDRVPHNAALNAGPLAWLALAAGFLTIALGLVVAWFAAPIAGVRDGPPRRTFAYCVSIYNYGYIAIPLCQLLVGRDAVAVMLLFNAGIETAIWTAGLATLTGHFTSDLWRRLVNPMTVAAAAALLLNRTGAAPAMPDWLCNTFSMLGGCAIPFGIFMVGMALPSLVAELNWREGLRTAAGAVVLRNIAVPLVMLAPVAAAAWAWVPALPAPLGAVLAIQAAMPAGIFPIVVAQHFGGDARVALRVVAWSSIAAILTLPLWLNLAASWITAATAPRM